MAVPRKLTVATGLTAYEGDPENDQAIASHEVRVSVTYELERGETDVPLLAGVKAAEVEAAHAAIWKQVRARRRPQSEAELDTAPSQNGGAGEHGRSGNGSGQVASRDGVTPSVPVKIPANAGHESIPTVSQPAEEPATTPQKLAIKAAARQAGMDLDALTVLTAQHYGQASLDRLTKEEADTLLKALQRDRTQANGKAALTATA